MWPGDPRCLSRPYLVEAVLHPVPAQLTHALPRGVFDQRFDARRGHLEELAATYRPLGALANRFYIRTGPQATLHCHAQGQLGCDLLSRGLGSRE